MTCTRCGSHNCSRSRRHGADFMLSPLGVYPWRCLDCRARFYARRVALRYLAYARCPRCGNLELMRIRSDRYRSDPFRSDLGIRLAVWFGARPVRCDLCRCNFASWRLLWPVEEESAPAEVEAEGAREVHR